MESVTITENIWCHPVKSPELQSSNSLWFLPDEGHPLSALKPLVIGSYLLGEREKWQDWEQTWRVPNNFWQGLYFIKTESENSYLYKTETPTQTNLSKRRFVRKLSGLSENWRKIFRDQDSSELPRIGNGQQALSGLLLTCLLLCHTVMAQGVITTSLGVTSLPAPVRKMSGKYSDWPVLGHMASLEQSLWSGEWASLNDLARIAGLSPLPGAGGCDGVGEKLLPQAKSVSSRRVASRVLGWHPHYLTASPFGVLSYEESCSKERCVIEGNLRDSLISTESSSQVIKVLSHNTEKPSRARTQGGTCISFLRSAFAKYHRLADGFPSRCVLTGPLPCVHILLVSLRVS